MGIFRFIDHPQYGPWTLTFIPIELNPMKIPDSFTYLDLYREILSRLDHNTIFLGIYEPEDSVQYRINLYNDLQFLLCGYP